MNKDINLFFALDDNYVPFLATSLESLEENANKSFNYNIKVLHSNSICQNNIDKIYNDYNKDNFNIEFVDITFNIERIFDKLHTRDYYSKSTYFRLLIPNLYPNMSKALYLDSDIIVLNNISKLYNIEMGENYVAGIPDGAVANVKEFQEYVQNVIGVKDYRNYFNAGILLMNLEKLREIQFENKFVDLLSSITFDVAQDQDYLNAICNGNVLIVDDSWNKMPFEEFKTEQENINLIHYNLAFKPWHKDGVLYEDIFWNYAKKTNFYDKILEIKNNYSPENIKKCDQQTINLIKNAKKQADNKERNIEIAQTIKTIMSKEYPRKAIDRELILTKIDRLEADGIFDIDLEDDPETKVLLPNKVDYLRKKLSSKIARSIAYSVARKFMNKLIKNKQLIIKKVEGIENWKNLETGAIITCNHFNAMDSFAMQYAYDQAKFKKRRFYKVIREGNYTSFGGVYGFFMRNCNTLPLSSNKKTMHKFIDAVDIILKQKEFILVYPEQSMWWNYRKPKPLKTGAYNLAVRNNVPVVPCFITMTDTNIIGKDGFPIQEYTIHIEKPIYPNAQQSKKENIENMMTQNYEVWKNTYEREYKIPLVYKTRKTA